MAITFESDTDLSFYYIEKSDYDKLFSKGRFIGDEDGIYFVCDNTDIPAIVYGIYKGGTLWAEPNRIEIIANKYVKFETIDGKEFYQSMKPLIATPVATIHGEVDTSIIKDIIY